MRVLHVITGLAAGGAEHQLRLLLQHTDAECEVVALTMSWYSSSETPSSAAISRGVAWLPVRLSTARIAAVSCRCLRYTERGAQSVFRNSSSMAPRTRMLA